jgi:hypothetical protein
MHLQQISCGLIFLLLVFLNLTLLASNARAFAKGAQGGEGPARYLDSGAPVVVISNASLLVDVRCHVGASSGSEDASEPAAEDPRSPRSTLKPGDHWSINLQGSDTEGPLLCTFRSALRKWNCDERWLIKDACLWEKPRGGSVANPDRQGLHLPLCPRCTSRNSVGKPICVWTIQDDGVYVQLWDAERKEDVARLEHPWREDDPAFYDPTGPSRFSVTNYFNNTVKIQCDVVSEPVFLEAASSRGSDGPHPKWGYEIHPVLDADRTYFTWTCDFEVLGTLLRRGGVQIWSPQPEVNTWIRTPDCTDCAWKLDATGLWLDDRSCYTNEPVWVREHLWDSVLNVSTTDELDWSPYFYPLKRSSHVHHVY